jgi:hypothetical protein
MPFPRLALTLTLVLGLGLAACGGGGSARIAGPGTLEVHNDVASFFVVEYVEVFDDFRGTLHTFDVVLFPGESLFVDLLPGPHDVLVVYEDSAAFSFPGVYVREGFITTVTTVH